jgi:hypothetical protein
VRGAGSLSQALCAAVLVLLVAAGAAPVAAAVGIAPLTSFLVKSGDIRGFGVAKARVFRTAESVRSASGENLPRSEIRRFEDEGFAEAAIVRLYGRAEPMAKGVSSAFQFETAGGARAEMNAELDKDFGPHGRPAEGEGSQFFTRRRFSVPGVPEAVAFAFMPNQAAEMIGVRAGVAKGMFVAGGCLISVGIVRPTSKDITGPVIRGIQSISRRTASCLP